MPSIPSSIRSRPDIVPPENASPIGLEKLQSLAEDHLPEEAEENDHLLNVNGQRAKVDRFFSRICQEFGRYWLERKEVEAILRELFGIVRWHIESLFEKNVPDHEIDKLRTNADQFIDNVCEGVRKLDEEMELSVATIRESVKRELAGLDRKEEDVAKSNLVQLRPEVAA